MAPMSPQYDVAILMVNQENHAIENTAVSAHNRTSLIKSLNSKIQSPVHRTPI